MDYGTAIQQGINIAAKAILRNINADMDYCEICEVIQSIIKDGGNENA